MRRIRFIIACVMVVLMLAACATPSEVTDVKTVDEPEVIEEVLDNAPPIIIGSPTFASPTAGTESEEADTDVTEDTASLEEKEDKPKTKEQKETDKTENGKKADDAGKTDKSDDAPKKAENMAKPATRADTSRVEVSTSSISVTEQEMQLIMQELFKQGKLDPSSDATVTLSEQEFMSLLNKIRQNGTDATTTPKPEAATPKPTEKPKESNTPKSTDTTTPKPATPPEPGEDPEKEPERNEPEPKEITASVSSSIGSSILSQVNEYRAQVGAPALEYSSAMQGAANARAQECIASFSHTRPDGSGASSVMAEYGVSYSGFGENLFYASGVSSISASTVTSAWMNSSGHRANILEPRFTSMCIGTAVSGSTVYVVQLFGAGVS